MYLLIQHECCLCIMHASDTDDQALACKVFASFLAYKLSCASQSAMSRCPFLAITLLYELTGSFVRLRGILFSLSPYRSKLLPYCNR